MDGLAIAEGETVFTHFRKDTSPCSRRIDSFLLQLLLEGIFLQLLLGSACWRLAGPTVNRTWKYLFLIITDRKHK